MIVKALKAMANALVGKKEENGPHPLDGPTKRALFPKRAQVEEQKELPTLNEASWPFPKARPQEPAKPAAEPKPAKKTPKQIAAEKRKAAANADKARAKKTKK